MQSVGINNVNILFSGSITSNYSGYFAWSYLFDVVMHPEDAKKILQNLVQNFLYKDMLLLEDVKKPDKIVKLLQALAFQVGSQVSYNELSKILGMNIATVEKYITILEQSFVLFRLSSFFSQSSDRTD